MNGCQLQSMEERLNSCLIIWAVWVLPAEQSRRQSLRKYRSTYVLATGLLPVRVDFRSKFQKRGKQNKQKPNWQKRCATPDYILPWWHKLYHGNSTHADSLTGCRDIVARASEHRSLLQISLSERYNTHWMNSLDSYSVTFQTVSS